MPPRSIGGGWSMDSSGLQIDLIGVSGVRASIGVMNEGPVLDPLAPDDDSPLPAGGGTAPSPVTDSVGQLPRALEILANRLRESTAARRDAPPGSADARRAEREIAYLRGLYLELQRRMEVPREIWLLERTTASGGTRHHAA